MPSIPSTPAPIRPMAAHVHVHEAPAATRPPPTLLGSGLGYRLGTAAVLTAALWAVVLWALA